MAIAIRDVAVGDTVYMRINSKLVGFRVVNQGRPSTMYDDSCAGTWLLMRDCYEQQPWHSSNYNDYANSTIHKYLNNGFLALFETDVQSIIKQVKIPYRVGAGTDKNVTSGANGLSAKIFLLSAAEVGCKTHSDDVTDLPWDEGATLSYFSGCNSDGFYRDEKRRAYFLTTPLPNTNSEDNSAEWWLRSPNCSDYSTYGNERALTVNHDGDIHWASCNDTYNAIRPALVLPYDTPVDPDTFTITFEEIEVPTPNGAHNTLVDGTAYVIKKGKVLVGGTSYNIAKGKTLVNGTAYNINFNKSISELGIGESVFMNVDGVNTEFLVVNQGRPSSLYDSSCDGTWVLMKDCYEQRAWNGSTSLFDYSQSSIHDYLCNSFPVLLDAFVRNNLKTAKIPYASSKSTIKSGSSGVSTRSFLLSVYELGWSGNADRPKDGDCLSYFNGADSNKRKANLNGSAINWWLRSRYLSRDYTWYVTAWGSNDATKSNNVYGIRPAMIFNFDTPVDDNNYIVP